MTDHSHPVHPVHPAHATHPVHAAHKAEPAKAKPAPEPQKFSLIKYADDESIALENGDWAGKKEDGRVTPPRVCSTLGVYLSFDEGHEELIRLRDEREAQLQKDHQNDKAKKAKESRETRETRESREARDAK